MIPSAILAFHNFAVIAATGHAPVRPSWIVVPDSRLERRFSVRCSHAWVGELFEALSERTGVTITAGSRDRTADHEVTVCIKAGSLATIMESVRALFSQKDGEWIWSQSSGQGGRLTYELSRSERACTLADRLRREVEQGFERGVADEIAWLGASSDERRAMEARDPDLTALMTGERLRGGVGMLANHLTPKQWRTVFDNIRELDPTRVTIPSSSLTPDEHAWADSVWGAAFQSVSDRPPLPDNLTVYAFCPSWDVTPTLMIGMGPAGDYGYAGGLPAEGRWRAQLDAAWRPPNEQISEHPAIADQALRARSKEEEAEDRPQMRGEPRRTAPSYSTRLEGRLMRIAEGVGIDIVAEWRADSAAEGVPPPFGKTVGEYFERLDRQIDATCKVHDGVLLVRDRGWMWNSPNEDLASWQQVERWRRSVARASGTLDLATVGELMALSKGAAARLSAEFPETGHRREQLCAFFGQLPSGLRLAAAHDGTPLSRAPRRALACLAAPGRNLPPEAAGWTFSVSSRAAEIPGPQQPHLRGVPVEFRVRRPGGTDLFYGFMSEKRARVRSHINIETHAPSTEAGGSPAGQSR